ncbi:MAG: radical SAM protein [Candidatus Hydrogenedentes bacterium]|nr:radical SAM protein [Candidatus Hydrogenedentota bacterium]
MDKKTTTARRSIAGLYRRIKRLHNAIPYFLMPGGRAFPALHYFLEVTRRCNLRCRMCQFREWYARTPAAEQAAGELTAAEWKSVIDQTACYSLITFTGGEPWVREDFEEILAYACQRRRAHVITNGLLLTEERIRRCVDLAPRRLAGRGLYFVGMSIDGTEDIHNAIRGRDDAFARTIENLTALARRRAEAGRKYPLLHVTSVIQDDNLEALPELAAIVGAVGADVLNLTMEIRQLDPEGIGTVDPETFCDAVPPPPRIRPERLAKYLDRVREATARAGIDLRLPDMPRQHVLAYHDGGLDLDEFTCRAAWSNLYIDARGGVFPCMIYRVGSVREQRLRTLWNCPEMRAFRRRLRDELYCICQGCCHLEYAGPSTARARQHRRNRDQQGGQP